jgi:hypothetical protein
LILPANTQAQNDFGQVDMSQIRQKKIRKFIQSQHTMELQGFSDLEPSVDTDSDLADFRNYEKEYLIRKSPEDVWYNYVNSSQTDIWDISKISFGMIYCRDSEAIVYADQTLYGLEPGRIYYINLKVLNGFYSLPVAFEITRIDASERLIEFSYLKGGKAEGKQIIRIADSEDGYSRIHHSTFVRSSSSFRDKYLYPFFHNKLINEFHFNMKKIIASRSGRHPDALTAVK